MPKYGNHHVITSNSPVLLLQAAPRTGHKNNPVAAATVAERSSVSDSNLRRCKEKWPACYAHSGSDLPSPILFFVAAKENGFACYGRNGSDLPRPILFFVAAKENGSACCGRCGTDLPRPILFFVAAKKNGQPADRH